MFVVERFLDGLVKINGKLYITNGGGTRYLMACRFLKLKHHIHSFVAKRKASLKGRCSISRIKLKDLMITFPVERMIVNHRMFGNG